MTAEFEGIPMIRQRFGMGSGSLAGWSFLMYVRCVCECGVQTRAAAWQSLHLDPQRTISPAT